MHTPHPGQSDPESDPNDGKHDEHDEHDRRAPPVPPDQADDIVPVKEPPGPLRGDEPMIG